MWFKVKNLSSSFLIKPFKYVTFIKDEDKNILRIISKERTEGGLNKGATFGAPLFSTLLVFPN